MQANTQTRALMIYLNNREVLEALGDAERGKLTLALLDYLEFGSLPDFSGALQMAFIVLRMDVDRSVSRWEEECARRSAAGKKSGAVRAAKKFGSNVSCKNDSADQDAADDPSDRQDAAPFPSDYQASTGFPGEAQGAAPFPSDEQGSTVFPSGEQGSTVFPSDEQSAAAGTNQNQNQNQNQNTNPNLNANQPAYPQGTFQADGPARGRDFELFWQAYPKKVGKQAAKKAFLRVPVPLDRLLSALSRQRAESQWQRDNGRYIPHPVTWLNQARWEDEPAAPPQDCGLYGVESL